MRAKWIFAILLGIIMAVSITEYTADNYAKAVLSGKQVACKWVKLAVRRHINDLAKMEEDPDYPYYFDVEEAKRVIDFVQNLKHTQGEWANPRLHNTKIKLEPWQQFIYWNLFGWRKKEDGCRRFTKGYIEIGRKNGKTVMAAATANYCFLLDSPREHGAEVYFLATKKDQAKKAWTEADLQIKKHPFLRTKIKSYKQNSTVVIPGSNAFMRPVGKDSDTEDSWNPHMVVVDEYHAHKTNELLNVYESGMGTRQQPLILIITTAGFDRNLPCYQEEHTLAEQVLEGAIDPVPENYFCIIYTLDEEDKDNFTDESKWVKANPNLGVSVKWDYLRDQVKQALLVSTKQNNVLTKNFNIWTNAFSRWIPHEKWDACKFKVSEKRLEGRPCYAGLDLSTNIDITAFVLVFPPQGTEKRYSVLFRFFIPEENLRERERQDKVPYSAWIKRGLVYATPGNVIDYDFIEEKIRQDSERFRIMEIAYDRWNATEIVNHMQEEGQTMVPFGQGYASMNPACLKLQKKIYAKEISHNGNPVMNWMVSCTEVKQDAAGNIKPVKPDRNKSGKRIDGVVALLMGMDRAVTAESDGEFDVGAVYGRTS